MVQTSSAVRLKPQTVQAFSAYVREAEAGMEQSLAGTGPFLWCDLGERPRPIRRGEIVAESWSGQGPVEVPNGLIHDWIGAVFIPGTTVKETLAMIQDYDNHKNVYQPEVIKIYLRLLKKKVITVILDTYHDVKYGSLDRTRWFCRSHTTRISEVEDAGSPNERVLSPDTGHGFLWRLYSYWRFQEQKGGVFTECRAVSLTRDVPFGLGWVIEPIIQQLPKESLINTLGATRRALQR